MRVLLTLLFVLGISFSAQTSDIFVTRLQSLPLGSDAEIHRALTDQVSKAVLNIWTQVPGNVDADGLPIWGGNSDQATSFPFVVENGEINYEFLRNQFTQFIDSSLRIGDTGVEKIKFSTRMALWNSAPESMFAFSNEFYLERNSDGTLTIPSKAYAVEFSDRKFLYVEEFGIASMKVVYNFHGEEVVVDDSGQKRLVFSNYFAVPLDAQREARQFGVPAKVILTYEDGEVREFDLDTGDLIGGIGGKRNTVPGQYSLSLELVKGAIEVHVAGSADEETQIQYSLDMVNWRDLGRVVLNDNGQGVYIDNPDARGQKAQGFYRAMLY